jgi:hypothetical protein
MAEWCHGGVPSWRSVVRAGLEVLAFAVIEARWAWSRSPLAHREARGGPSGHRGGRHKSPDIGARDYGYDAARMRTPRRP